MKLISKDVYIVVAKEEIEYVDKKTGELKKLRKLYINNKTDGIQEQILVNEKSYNEFQKGMEGLLEYEKSNNGCYLKGFIKK